MAIEPITMHDIKSVGNRLPTVDERIKERSAEDRSHAIREVVNAWSTQQDDERTLRKSYGTKMLWGLFAQAVLVNVAFFAIGFEWVSIDEWTARVFIVGVFTELAVVTRIIVKYLFRDNTGEVFGFINEIHV